jgi:rare lipoprotein A (peptidoglycan hydrolase)
VSAALGFRLLALAALALVGALIALAVTDRGGTTAPTNALPDAAPAPGGGWYHAIAAPAPASQKTRRTACGETLDARTVGLAHPTLPCNVKLFIEYGGKRVLTQVIDRGPYIAGREFQLTKALADKIGLHSVAEIRWRFAAAPQS